MVFHNFLHSCPFSQLDFLLTQYALDKCAMLDKTTWDYDWDSSLHRQGGGGEWATKAEPALSWLAVEGKQQGLGSGCSNWEQRREWGWDLNSSGNGRGQLVRRTNPSQKRETKWTAAAAAGIPGNSSWEKTDLKQDLQELSQEQLSNCRRDSWGSSHCR